MSTDTLILGNVTYERHALSSVFPPMSPKDYSLLLASMRELGQQAAIKLIEERLVFDGWNRLRACAELNIEPMFEHIAPNQNLQALAIAFNLAHRHLTAGQKGLIAGQLATLSHGGGRLGAGRPAESTVVDEDEIDHKNEDLRLDLDSPEPEASAPAATSETAEPHQPEAASASNSIKASAERMGISRATAAMGKRVVEEGDDSLLQAVKSGEISLADGYVIAKSPREEQRDRVRSALANGKEWLKTHKKPRELAEKVAKSVLKGDELPQGLTDEQLTSVFLRVANMMVVGTRSCATCLDAHSTYFTDSDITQIETAHKRLGEALAKRINRAAA